MLTGAVDVSRECVRKHQSFISPQAILPWNRTELSDGVDRHNMAIASFPNNIAIQSIQQLRWLEGFLRCRLQLPLLESRDWNLNQMVVRLCSEDPCSRFFSWIDISVEMMAKKNENGNSLTCQLPTQHFSSLKSLWDDCLVQIQW